MVIKMLIGLEGRVEQLSENFNKEKKILRRTIQTSRIHNLK